MGRFLREKKYHIQDRTLTLWAPSAGHANLYILTLGKVAEQLRRILGDETIQVGWEVRPEAFPELSLLQTAQERWEALKKVAPLADEILRRAKGQVIPKDIQAYLQPQQDEPTSEGE